MIQDIFSQLILQWQQQSVAEIIAVALSVAYVWLATQQSVWCWPAALVSTMLFTYVFWDVQLLFQMLLNGYYAIMAVVGWLSWNKNTHISVHGVKSMPLGLHVVILVCGTGLSVLVLNFAQHWLSYENLLLDAGTTIFSLLVTWLTVRKYLQSWLYWVLINVVSVYLFATAGLYFATVLMLIYIIFSIRGYVSWNRSQSIQKGQLSNV